MLDLQIEPVVRAALLEDLGRAGDLTTDATVPADLTGSVALVARDAGVVAGSACARLAWTLVDPRVQVRGWRRRPLSWPRQSRAHPRACAAPARPPQGCAL